MSNKETDRIKSIHIDEELKYLNKLGLPAALEGYPPEYFVVLKRLHTPLTSPGALAILNQFFNPGNRTEAQRIVDTLREVSNVFKAHLSPIYQGFSICPTNETFLDRWVKSIKPSKQEFAENRIRDLLGLRLSDDEIEAFIEDYQGMNPKEYKRWYSSHIERHWQTEITLKELTQYCQVAHEGEKGWNYENIRKLT